MRSEGHDDTGALVSLEADPATDDDRAAAAQAGLGLVREVLQLRVPLPLDAAVDDAAAPLVTRPFRPGIDDDEFLRVNNRAFAWHPEQSDWTSAHLRTRFAEPWFDPTGFLLHEIDGHLAGFCWTKVHAATTGDPAMGEIFVIGVDPDDHGRGLGRALVVAGLDHLAAAGLTVGMLHVEADNEVARRLYDDLGFTIHSSHCWWHRPGSDERP